MRDKVVAQENTTARLELQGSQTDFLYKPPPDFTKAFLKKKSDCDFQGFAAEAILKHVDLKKTSH